MHRVLKQQILSYKHIMVYSILIKYILTNKEAMHNS